MFNWTTKHGAIEAAPKMFPFLHAEMAKLKVMDCINYAIIDEQLRVPRAYPPRPVYLDMNANPTANAISRSVYINGIYKDEVKVIEEILSANLKIQTMHRTASLVFETHFAHDHQLILAMKSHSMLLDHNLDIARATCLLALPPGPGHIGGIEEMLIELREGRALNPLGILPAYLAWETARSLALPIVKFRYVYDLLLSLCKPDDVSFAKIIADFYLLTDAKLKFCKFESSFDRLKQLLAQSGHALDQHIIETRLCSAITNPNFKTEVNALRIDLQKPAHLRVHTESSLRFNIRALILHDDTLDSPVSTLRGNAAQLDVSAPPAIAAAATVPVVRGARSNPRKANKASTNRKVTFNSTAAPIASGLKPSPRTRLDPRDPANATTIANQLAKHGAPSPTQICNRCGRVGHYYFQCYAKKCTVCGLSLSITGFHQLGVGGAQCK